MAKQRTETIREQNTLGLIRSLRARGPIARIDLGHLNGISSATVTSITADLQAAGLVEEHDSEPVRNGGRGRPKTLIQLDPHAAFVICAKLSINELRLVVGDFAGELRESEVHTLDTLALSPEGLCELLEAKIEALTARVRHRYVRFAGICIALQGTVHGGRGAIAWSPALRFRNAPVCDRLGARFNCPVLLENDANCIARALADRPEYAGYANLVVIMLGYGVGMSVFMEGHPYLGANGSAAEFGHSKYEPDGALCACGRRGCIEAYIGDYALYRDGRSMLTLPPGDSAHPSEAQMQALTEHAERGDPTAMALFDKAGRVLGYGIANVMALFNPDLVLITGSGVRAYDVMKPAIDRAVHEALVDELIGPTRVTSTPWDHDMTFLGGIATALKTTDPDTVLAEPDAAAAR